MLDVYFFNSDSTLRSKSYSCRHPFFMEVLYQCKRFCYFGLDGFFLLQEVKGDLK